MSESLAFNLKIDCDNAAFEGDPRPEIARCLREVADSVEAGGNLSKHLNIRDINGNIVGTFVLKPNESV